MFRGTFFRFVVPALLGILVGFLTLAYAVPNEQNLPVPLVSLLSPGLKTAELVMPASHQSLAWTFGWFLRIALGVNGFYYFLMFVLSAHLARRASSSEK